MELMTIIAGWILLGTLTLVLIAIAVVILKITIDYGRLVDSEIDESRKNLK